MRITKFQIWLLTFIAKKLVKQSFYHKSNITAYYGIIIKESRKQFDEDNRPTLNSFLEECHTRALEEN